MNNPAKDLMRNEEETREEQRILASNAWHLARYVIEHDYEIQMPKNFNPGEFLDWSERYPSLTKEEKIDFVNQYADLEKATKSVTARTLVATRIHGRGFFHAALLTSVGRYLVFLSLFAALFIYLLITNITTDDGMSNILIPFCAAGLGTCVFLLRVTQEKLKRRSFDPAFIPSHLVRLGLGVLAGGSIVLFPDLVSIGNDATGSGQGVAVGQQIGIGQGSLAFILGYAVDIFYAVLDKIGGRVK